MAVDHPRDDRRPLREGVDGDDVWPALTASQLHAIAVVDEHTGQREREDQWKPGVMERLVARLGGVALYSFAERVRHYKYLVDAVERRTVQDWEVLTELGCRTVVERLLGEVPEELRERLRTELVTPLDDRFRAATIDDGGAFLRRQFGDQVGTDGWWWARRPASFTDGERTA